MATQLAGKWMADICAAQRCGSAFTALYFRSLFLVVSIVCAAVSMSSLKRLTRFMYNVTPTSFRRGCALLSPIVLYLPLVRLLLLLRCGMAHTELHTFIGKQDIAEKFVLQQTDW